MNRMLDGKKTTCINIRKLGGKILTSVEDIKKLLINRKDDELLALLDEEKNQLTELLLNIAKNDSDWKFRRDAIKILGKGKITKSINTLNDILLKDHLTILRKTAAKAMGTICDPAATDSLIKALETSKDPAIIIEVVNALGCLKAKNAVDLLIQMLQTSQDGEIRENIAEALGLIGDPKAVEVLLEVLKNDKEDWVRGQAAEALGLIGDEKAVSDLIKTLEIDFGIGVSAKTATALGRLKNASAVESLINFLQKEKNADNRRSATYALGEIGDRRAAEIFLELIQTDSDESVRYWSCLALGFMQYKGAANELLNLVKNDSSVRIRKTALSSLRQILPKTKKTLNQLLEILREEKDNDLKEKILELLQNIANELGYKDIKVMIESMDLAE